MQKSQTVTNQPVKESERLDSLIGEMRERISGINAELAMVNQQNSRHAEQEVLDEQAVGSLRTRKAGILADLELFSMRLAAFKQKKAEAERQEAQTRVNEIEAEMLELSEQGVMSLLENYRGC